jgi:sugar phosphate isomerase/epimerase
MMNGIAEGFTTLKNHICSTHIHDNDGVNDSHLWPGNGTIDWKGTMELLRTAPLKPPLLLEIDGEEKKSPSEEVIATFRKLEDE